MPVMCESGWQNSRKLGKTFLIRRIMSALLFVKKLSIKYEFPNNSHTNSWSIVLFVLKNVWLGFDSRGMWRFSRVNWGQDLYFSLEIKKLIVGKKTWMRWWKKPSGEDIKADPYSYQKCIERFGD